MIDTNEWKRLGYVPSADAARALNLPRISLHRYMSQGVIPYETQGRFRFVKVDDLVAWIKSRYTDRQLAAQLIRSVRALLALRAPGVS